MDEPLFCAPGNDPKLVTIFCDYRITPTAPSAYDVVFEHGPKRCQESSKPARQKIQDAGTQNKGLGSKLGVRVAVQKRLVGIIKLDTNPPMLAMKRSAFCKYYLEIAPNHFGSVGSCARSSGFFLARVAARALV
jgi:hypothetical protein